MTRLILILSVIAVCSHAKSSRSAIEAGYNEYTYLWDLSTDPTEGNNLLATNADIASDLKAKAADWISEIVAAETTDDSYKKKTWKAAGGVVPWLDDDSKRDISVVYNSAKNPPNIVFVLVDDWGMNDVGYQSNYLTTPNIDKLASQGIKLTNYWTSTLCTPSRGALMTAKYPFRLGLSEKDDGELPLSEVTIAEEMKTAGYRTGMVGKWHMGFSSNSYTPLNRGFDTFYGFYNGFIDYWTKEYSNYLDLHDGYDLETDVELLSSDLHNGYVISRKVEEAIATHAKDYADTPLFLYVASQLIHEDWQAPSSFIERCAGHTTTSPQATYCAMNLMVDEFIANTTCALEKNGMGDNTILIVASDNGGDRTMFGNSYPYRGGKGNYFRGGVGAAAFIHSNLIPENRRGYEYSGLVHVTDWLPTLMGLATEGEWTGSLVGSDLDGTDVWDAVMNDEESPRSLIVHYVNADGEFSIQEDNWKLDSFVWDMGYAVKEPVATFTEDHFPEKAQMECDAPSLVVSAMGASGKARSSSSSGGSGSTTTMVSSTTESGVEGGEDVGVDGDGDEGGDEDESGENIEVGGGGGRGPPGPGRMNYGVAGSFAFVFGMAIIGGAVVVFLTSMSADDDDIHAQHAHARPAFPYANDNIIRLDSDAIVTTPLLTKHSNIAGVKKDKLSSTGDAEANVLVDEEGSAIPVATAAYGSVEQI